VELLTVVEAVALMAAEAEDAKNILSSQYIKTVQSVGSAPFFYS
jgi:hypothetical protein